METSLRCNDLLQGLDASTRRAFVAASEVVEFTSGDALAVAGERTEFVYFPESGIASLASHKGDVKVEVALIGSDGIVGSWILMGEDRSPFAVSALSRVEARRMRREALVEMSAAIPSLRDAILRSVHDQMVTFAESCRAVARLSIEARLARWFLMADDRLDGDTIAITHDMLAQLLGVRRPGITVATHVLEGEGMIRATRGTIRIVDRDKLKALAGLAYRPVARVDG